LCEPPPVDAGVSCEEVECGVGERCHEGSCVRLACDSTGECPGEGVCSVDSGVCTTPVRTVSCVDVGCESEQRCDEVSGLCMDATCIDLGCERGWLCNQRTEECELDTCLRIGCDVGKICIARTGACVDGPDGGVAEPDAGAMGMDGGLSCDPLDSDACESFDNCVWDGTVFACQPISVDVPTDAPCTVEPSVTSSACSQGNACLPPSFHGRCLTSFNESCCAAYCDVEAAVSSCGMDQHCAPYPGAEDSGVGVCVYWPIIPCDPLSGGDCLPNERCGWRPDLSVFACAEAHVTVLAGSVCNAPGDCEFGAACVNAASLAECAGERCCAALCDATGLGLDSCAMMGASCSASPEWEIDYSEFGICL
jgi:hypothetical protein